MARAADPADTSEAPDGPDSDVEGLLVEHLPGLRAFVRLRASRPIRDLESCSDLVQSVCREVLQHRGRFQHSGPDAFRRWLYVTALRKIQNRARHWTAARRDGRPAPLQEERTLLDAYASVTTASQVVQAREQIERIEAAFDRLSDEQREAITSVRLLGMSHRELADRMGRSEPATRQLLARATARLAALLGAPRGGDA